jgi:alpha-beta hydrolase superfamily lysophospholipase
MARALIVFAHADAAHAARYQYAAARLNGAGHVVVALDDHDRGHAETPRGHRFTAAAAALATRVEAERAAHGLPVVMLGYGGGAALGLHYAISHPDALAGLILTAPRAQVPDGRMKAWYHSLTSALLPDAEPMTLDPQVAARDSRTLADWFADPLTRMGPTAASTAAENARRAAALMDGVDTLTLPTLLLWGTQEGLSPPGGAEHLLGALEHADLTRHSFDAFYDELLSGPARDAVLDAIVSWLDQHIPAS